MTKHINIALKKASRRINADYRSSKKIYDRLCRKACSKYGLNLDDAELHDYEDGFSSALAHAMRILKEEMSAAGIEL